MSPLHPLPLAPPLLPHLRDRFLYDGVSDYGHSCSRSPQTCLGNHSPVLVPHQVLCPPSARPALSDLDQLELELDREFLPILLDCLDDGNLLIAGDDRNANSYMRRGILVNSRQYDLHQRRLAHTLIFSTFASKSP